MSTTGGPAFPFVQWRSPDGMIHSDLSAGMTLRDWFAGQIIAAIIETYGIKYASNVTAHALFAYEQADAMLKAREGKP